MSPARRELFHRHPSNPILSAADWPYPVNAVFNPAATVAAGKTVLLARVETLTGISHLTVARSENGATDWTVENRPLLAPLDGVEGELWGFEDPRIVWLTELDRWAITCTTYGPAGPAVYLATTTDFETVERHGVVMPPEDKNAAFLPERIDGEWVLFHRPMTAFGASRGEILLSRSPDLETWSDPEQVLQPRHGAWWDSLRIGIGPPPLRTARGWLVIYHGVKETVTGGIYRVGLALAAIDEPARVIGRAPSWVLGPLAPYERQGDVPNVVFPCGLVHDQKSNELRLYYGAADTSICLATADLDEVLDAIEPVAAE